MGPIGKYESTNKFTYEGPDAKLQKIKVETTLTYQPPGQSTSASLPFKIKSADLKSKSATGTVYFDNEKHRFDHSESNLKLDGTLKVNIGGMDSDVKLTQEQKTTVATSDKNPVASK